MAKGNILDWLGFDIDFTNKTVSLSSIKAEKIKIKIQNIMKAYIVRRKDLESFIGTLAWVSLVFILARPYLQRLYALFYSNKRNWIRISLNIKRDLEMWSKIIANAQLVCPSIFVRKHHTVIYTDASILGLGGWISDPYKSLQDSIYFFVEIEENFTNKLFEKIMNNTKKTNKNTIAILEALAIGLGLHTWYQYYGMDEQVVIQVYSDNEASVKIMKKWYAKKEPIATILRKLVLEASTKGYWPALEYINTKNNYIADAISRGEYKYYFKNEPIKYTLKQINKYCKF